MFVQEHLAPLDGERFDTPGRGRETILLVEDDTDVRITTRRLLERMGFHVFDAGSPRAALDLVVVHRRGIDLVLTDVLMPGMNGRALAAAIRILRPRIPVLFMSAYGDDDVTRRPELDEPGFGFIAKPFTAATLSAAVRALLDTKFPR